jgi:hypothetical protein
MFRFAIRDVLWLTVVVAVTLALWMAWSRDRTRLAKALRESNEQLQLERGKAAILHVGDESRPMKRGQKMLVSVHEDGAVQFQLIVDSKPPIQDATNGPPR